MQDNHLDKIWRDKLGSYQAPADPQDWADMTALLDAQDAKRAGFFWWWLIAVALFVTVGGGLYHLMQLQNDSIDAFAISGTAGNTDVTAHNTTSGENTPASAPNSKNDTSNNNSNPTNAIEGDALNTSATTTDSNLKSSSNVDGQSTDVVASSPKQTEADNNKGHKGNKGAKRKNGNTGNTGSKTSKGNLTANTNGSPSNTSIAPSSVATTANTNTNTSGNDGYDKPVGTIGVKRLKQLPNQLMLNLAQSQDTSRFLNDYVFKRPRAVQHHLGLSTGWVHSRVDRSGDYRPAYNIGLQYTMMVKNRAGFHVGLMYRQYRYYTDLVACNYDIYQCPNSYSSTLQTIDLNVGVQVNLVKTDKIEWYAMGGVSNQFMMSESFEYNLPAIDTTNPNPVPNIPPTNTSFTGAGASDFESSIDASFDFNSLITSGGAVGTGKFLRERYLGAWYVGTGVTWHFANRMNLQLEPVIGRSFQFVGIQDKKLWQTGVNVRWNVRLGR